MNKKIIKKIKTVLVLFSKIVVDLIKNGQIHKKNQVNYLKKIAMKNIKTFQNNDTFISIKQWVGEK